MQTSTTAKAKPAHPLQCPCGTLCSSTGPSTGPKKSSACLQTLGRAAGHLQSSNRPSARDTDQLRRDAMFQLLRVTICGCCTKSHPRVTMRGCCTKSNNLWVLHQESQSVGAAPRVTCACTTKQPAPSASLVARCKHLVWNAPCAQGVGGTSCSPRREQRPEGRVTHTTWQQARMLDRSLQEGTLAHHAASRPLAGPSGGSTVSCLGACVRICASVLSARPCDYEQQFQRAIWTSQHHKRVVERPDGTMPGLPCGWRVPCAACAASTAASLPWPCPLPHLGPQRRILHRQQ